MGYPLGVLPDLILFTVAKGYRPPKEFTVANAFSKKPTLWAWRAVHSGSINNTALHNSPGL